MKFLYSICTDIEKAIHAAIKGLNPDKVFVLCDTNTNTHCLPHLHCSDYWQIFIVPSGEKSKTVDWACSIWQWLLLNEASRSSLLINLGGGMICDLGGFAASTYKRGMRFVHVPTSLMAMIDAAHGGKTGINFRDGKNLVGTFYEANQVLIYKPFLESLDNENILSGFAEMIKHSLLSDEKQWKRFSKLGLEGVIPEWIETSILTKKHYVIADPLEHNLRKSLNFGHTVGHAIESAGIENGRSFSHGRCVAWGMMVELILSHSICGFELSEMHEILAFLDEIYGKPQLNDKDTDLVLQWIRQDKKNTDSVWNFTLLEAIGKPRINIQVNANQVVSTFKAVQKFIL